MECCGERCRRNVPSTAHPFRAITASIHSAIARRTAVDAGLTARFDTLNE